MQYTPYKKGQITNICQNCQNLSHWSSVAQKGIFFETGHIRPKNPWTLSSEVTKSLS